VASQGVKVSLDGQGADEIFGGYPRHLETWFWEHMAHGIFPPAFSHVLKPALFQKLKSLPGAYWHRKLMLQFKPESQIFTNEILALAEVPPDPEESLNGQLHRDFTSQTLPFLLKAADRNSMRWSVESRMPFADFVPLAEMLFSIPECSGTAALPFGRSLSIRKNLFALPKHGKINRILLIFR
jgi:asparagine synthase (glutamine-hydrolysing)